MTTSTQVKIWILSSVAVSTAAFASYLVGNKPAESLLSPKVDSNRSLELGASQATAPLKEEVQVILNDPALENAWGLKKADAERAWELTQGNRSIVVAVIDTGADTNHEDLKSNIWVNAGETGLDANGKDKRTNGIDDDGNGFVDDVHGWDFVTNSPLLIDNHGHGTHIAGIIGAEAGNGKGIAGVSPKVSMMILKYFDPKHPHTDNLKNTIKAIDYAVQMKAHIINYSGGGTEYSQAEFEAVQRAEKAGILFVAAAGNERSNSDQHKYFPADYALSNVISVTAIDQSTEVLPSSNWGIETVDLAAPGHNVLSTLPRNQYGFMTGTSQATAFVTGAAVLLMAHRDFNTPEKLKKYILSTGDANSSLVAKTRTNRKLNLYKALTMLDGGTSATGLVAANMQDSPRFGTGEVAPSRTAANAGLGQLADFSKDLLMQTGRTATTEKN